MSAVVHPRLAARRGAARASTWWGRAWVRAVEEASYTETDLRRARSLSRSGGVGGITVDTGSFVASVDDDRGLWTAHTRLPVLDEGARATLVEVVAAQAGRIGSLLAGDLPHSMVEHADEAGVELLPYGGELEASCTCEGWLDPCVHALAVMYQLTWLLERDPFVLLHLRGLARDELLGRLHDRERGADPATDPATDPDEATLDTAVDAALRARRLLELLETPDASFEHLL